jgi:hypothetical protein
MGRLRISEYWAIAEGAGVEPDFPNGIDDEVEDVEVDEADLFRRLPQALRRPAGAHVPADTTR